MPRYAFKERMIVNRDDEKARAPDGVAQLESPEEAIREARDLVFQLTRTVNTRRIHLPNNLVYHKFFNELNAKVKRYVAKWGTLIVGVHCFEFQYEGESIYCDSDQGDSLPFRFYKDGLNELAFYPGVTEEELRDFVETIYRSYEVEAEEDDLVTLLWNQHFQHISYKVIDEPLEGQTVPEPAAAAPESRAARPVSSPARDVKPEMPLLRETFVLTEQEVARLREEMTVEAGWDMGFQLVDLIYEVLAVREEMDDYPLALDVMERVIRQFVRRGRFGHAARTLKALRDLEQNSAALPERHRTLLHQAVERTGDADRIQEIGETLNRGLDSEIPELETYLRLLPRGAVEPLMDLLGEVKQRKGRRVLCEVLADLLGDNLQPLVKRLDDPRWFVVRNLVYILRQSGSRIGATKCLHRTLAHPHPKVRQETLRSMEAMGMAQSPEFLLGLLESRDEICRTWALERLAALGDPRAAEPLWKQIQARAFREWPWHDKRAYFEALGRCAPPAMLPAVKGLFQKRSWFEKPKDLEVRAGAAIALGLIGGEQVIALLEEGCHAEEALMCEACRQGLDTIRRAKAGDSPTETTAQTRRTRPKWTRSKPDDRS